MRRIYLLTFTILLTNTKLFAKSFGIPQVKTKNAIAHLHKTKTLRAASPKLNRNKAILKKGQHQMTSMNNLSPSNPGTTPRTAIIGGIAKDIEKFIPNMEANLEKIRGAFDKTITLLVTDGNSDDTENLLITYTEKTTDTLFFKIKNHGTKNRTDRIAYARNELLSIMDDYLDQYSYIVTMDLDMWDVNTQAIKETLDNESQWDVATANDPELYYDTWALRTKDYDKSCWKPNATGFDCNTLKSFFPNEDMHTQIPIDHKPIPVISAYGGLGIYKSTQLKACRAHGDCIYDGIGEGPGNMDCEHVKFHKKLTQYTGAKITIWPRLTLKHCKVNGWGC